MEAMNYKEMLKELDYEIFAIDNKVVYTLKEALDIMSSDLLDYYCYMYKTFFEEYDIVLNTDKLKKEYILDNYDSLFTKIFLTNLNIEEINIIKKSYDDNDPITNKNALLLSYALLLEFKNNNKITYVIPEEVFDSYNKLFNSNKRKKINKDNAYNYLYGYLAMNGIIPISFLEDLLLNVYKLALTKRELKEVIDKEIEKEMVNIYEDEYYTLLDIKDVNIKTLLKNKKEHSYLILPETRAIDYFNFFSSFLKKIERILKIKDYDLALFIFELVSISLEKAYPQLNKFCDSKADDIYIDNKDCLKIKKLIDDNLDNIRLWIYNGRNNHDIKIEYRINTFMIKKGNKTDLKTCLESLDSKILAKILKNNDCKNINDVVERMLKAFISYIENLRDIELYTILSEQDVVITNESSIDLNIYMFSFFYIDEEKNKRLIIPSEFINIVKERYDNISLYSISNDNIVNLYIRINGVIEKNKLQELLKEYHNIDISIDELDKIANEYDFSIVDNYYCEPSGFKRDELNTFLKFKTFDKYRKIDMEYLEKNKEYSDKIIEIVDNLNLTSNAKQNLKENIILLTRTYGLSSKTINYLKSVVPSVKDDFLQEVLDIYNYYKDYLYNWHYNGYSIIEYEEINKRKNVKVGRNEPCPCGSGKKYKHCCGR